MTTLQRLRDGEPVEYINSQYIPAFLFLPKEIMDCEPIEFRRVSRNIQRLLRDPVTIAQVESVPAGYRPCLFAHGLAGYGTEMHARILWAKRTRHTALPYTGLLGDHAAERLARVHRGEETDARVGQHPDPAHRGPQQRPLRREDHCQGGYLLHRCRNDRPPNGKRTGKADCRIRKGAR